MVLLLAVPDSTCNHSSEQVNRAWPRFVGSKSSAQSPGGNSGWAPAGRHTCAQSPVQLRLCGPPSVPGSTTPLSHACLCRSHTTHLCEHQPRALRGAVHGAAHAPQLAVGGLRGDEQVVAGQTVGEVIHAQLAITAARGVWGVGGGGRACAPWWWWWWWWSAVEWGGFRMQVWGDVGREGREGKGRQRCCARSAQLSSGQQEEWVHPLPPPSQQVAKMQRRASLPARALPLHRLLLQAQRVHHQCITLPLGHFTTAASTHVQTPPHHTTHHHPSNGSPDEVGVAREAQLADSAVAVPRSPEAEACGTACAAAGKVQTACSPTSHASTRPRVIMLAPQAP